MSFLSLFADLVTRLAELVEPVFHASATAAAIVLFTALVRLLVLPLSRAAARGERARTALAPRLAELRAKHKDPQRLQEAAQKLYAEEKTSPLAGCLPSLLQLPAFFLLFHLFSAGSIGDEPNSLLDHGLLGAPLDGRWADALADGGVLGTPGLVYLALLVLVATSATWSYLRARRRAATAPATTAGPPEMPGAAGLAKVLPLMPFLTLFSVAFLPLAAALYVVTSTTWGTVERALLHRERRTSNEEDGTTGASRNTTPATPANPATPARRKVSRG